MIKKYPLCLTRVRKPPKQFSWVDQRLIRDGHVKNCSHSALSLYLFLITVSDSKGLSYYSDASIIKYLNMESKDLNTARKNLIDEGLIQYKEPLYQVLALDINVFSHHPERVKNNTPTPIGNILKHLLKEPHHDRL